MKHTEMNETSNRELITISRAEYEAMQAQLAEQNQLCVHRAKTTP